MNTPGPGSLRSEVRPEKEPRSARRLKRRYDRITYLEDLESRSERSTAKHVGPELPRVIPGQIIVMGAAVLVCPLCQFDVVKRGSVKYCLYRLECPRPGCGWVSRPIDILVRFNELDLCDIDSKTAQLCAKYWEELDAE